MGNLIALRKMNLLFCIYVLLFSFGKLLGLDQTAIDTLHRNDFHYHLLYQELKESAQNDNFVLFSLAPGDGEQFKAQVQQQIVPNYFLKLAEKYPEAEAKIIAIDPLFSLDSSVEQYAFLYESNWTLLPKLSDSDEKNGFGCVRFRKGNVEIVFITLWIPQENFELVMHFSQMIKRFATNLLDREGILFIGNHGSAFDAFKPFWMAYNELQNHSHSSNVQMYVCSGDQLPWSGTKLYGQVKYDQAEINNLYLLLEPFFNEWMSEGKGWFLLAYEEKLKILQHYYGFFKPQFLQFRDLSTLSFNVTGEYNRYQIVSLIEK
ncbi:MAG: hypothetical protein H0X29_07785 [Parachlamydiaceae bacterium]|nr:hypothetical protein [Parachlamydiaceae bacterium]